jgi:hypothetical protein
MKKLLSFLVIFGLILIFPLTILAHGGVEKRAGNILVTLFQTPLSPLVGENVNFAFILTDPTQSKRFVKKSTRLVITKTAYNDPKNDKIVYTKTFTSDVNGTIDFSYTFPTTNYYDIDLQFGKPNDEASTTGFLVQPRQNNNDEIDLLSAILAISLLMNVVFLFLFLRFYKRKITFKVAK